VQVRERTSAGFVDYPCVVRISKTLGAREYQGRKGRDQAIRVLEIWMETLRYARTTRVAEWVR